MSHPTPAGNIPPETRRRLGLLMLALAAGDALGSTSEFLPTRQVVALYQRVQASGWPFRQVGGGTLHWRPGEPTDDSNMAMCLVRSFVRCGRFDGEDVAGAWIGWLETDPPDVGGTTRQALLAVARGRPWYEGGLPIFQANPHAEANGSLMRNAVTPAMADSLEEVLAISLKQGIVTHYAPLPVLCCGVQSYLIRQMLLGHDPLGGDWPGDFATRWTDWIEGETDPVVAGWRERVGRHLDEAWAALRAADFDPDRFDPFTAAIRGKDGWCLLTLQIALWAVQWSRRGTPLPAPAGYPEALFQRAVGPHFLSVVPLIGHDADTYAATAAPLIAACHGHVPGELADGLQIRPELDRLAGQ